ncbi:MAG TPA: hypothetical protein VLT35_01180 [Methanocella sp.]|nr:hypothetical protein [Methanocella sp.]
MGKSRALELMPFFVLIAIVAMLSSATLASASLAGKEFNIPNLRGHFAFGYAAPAKDSLTLADMAASTGSFSPFQSSAAIPVVKKSVLMPDGPRTLMRKQLSFSTIG